MSNNPERHFGPCGGRLHLAGLVLTCVSGGALGRFGHAQGAEPPGGPPAVSPQGDGKPPATVAPAPTRVRGQLSSRYWIHWTGDSVDNDLFETLTLDVGDEKKDGVTGHLLGRVAADLDGDEAYNAQFFGLEDAIGGSVDSTIYDAYADFHRVPGLAMVRAGRQMMHDTPELAYFDGVRAETLPWTTSEVQFGVYGGVSSHLYESSATGDWTVGIYGQARPWRDGRLRFDFMHLEDEVLLGAHNNDLVSAEAWQTFGALQLEGHFTRLEGHNRDVRARAAYADTAAELLTQLTFYQLLRTQTDLVIELDPFVNATQELFPYWQVGGLVGKGLFQHTELQLGADVRTVSDSGDVGTYNRDYERWFGTLHVRDLPWTGFTMSVTGDWWDSDGQVVRSWGADLGYKVADATSVSAGSYYSLYKFDVFLNTERDHVRTYYCKLQHKMSKAWSFDGSYEFEQTDIDDFHVLRMGVLWRF